MQAQTLDSVNDLYYATETLKNITPSVVIAANASTTALLSSAPSYTATTINSQPDGSTVIAHDLDLKLQNDCRSNVPVWTQELTANVIRLTVTSSGNCDNYAYTTALADAFAQKLNSGEVTNTSDAVIKVNQLDKLPEHLKLATPYSLSAIVPYAIISLILSILGVFILFYAFCWVRRFSTSK
ncbi:hypothetical protein FACS1894125_5380 [Actinomycetota bacterium]|nr:hypothetical protein FACS1894125_5380 [Actinomycetota bacterium]